MPCLLRSKSLHSRVIGAVLAVQTAVQVWGRAFVLSRRRRGLSAAQWRAVRRAVHADQHAGSFGAGLPILRDATPDANTRWLLEDAYWDCLGFEPPCADY